MIRKVIFTCTALLLCVSLLPSTSFAHVKWFTEAEAERISLDTVLSPLFFSMTFFTAVCLGILLIIMHYFRDAKILKRLHQHTFSTEFTHYLLQYGLSIALLLQLVNGAVLAPEFHVDSVYPFILIGITIVLLLIPRLALAKIASIILLYMYADFAVRFGLFHLIDYIFYIGIIGYFLLLETRWERFKFPFLMMTLGFSLCWLSAEKWIYPEMALNIIEIYGVPTFGFQPLMFVKMAAFVEFAIGVSWMMCLYNRFFAVLFTIVSTLMTFMFGYMELVGHFLIIIFMLVFIAQNDSLKSLPSLVCRTLKGQITFVGANFVFIVFSFVLIYYRFA